MSRMLLYINDILFVSLLQVTRLGNWCLFQLRQVSNIFQISILHKKQYYSITTWKKFAKKPYRVPSFDIFPGNDAPETTSNEGDHSPNDSLHITHLL